MNEYLGTMTGIVTLTLLLLQVVKRQFGTAKYIKDIPVWLIANVIGITLTLLANQILKTLEGDTLQLLWQAVGMTSSASGFYEWLRQGDKTLEEVSKK
jgi:hypothetical protein